MMDVEEGRSDWVGWVKHAGNLCGCMMEWLFRLFTLAFRFFIFIR